jgi:hypothetical protein
MSTAPTKPDPTVGPLTQAGRTIASSTNGFPRLKIITVQAVVAVSLVVGVSRAKVVC